MEIVDQSLNHDLPIFPTFPATADMVSKLTFNHRMHGFTFPSLSINAIQAGSFHPFGPGLPFRIRQLPSSSNRRDKVGFLDSLSVESSICYCKPGIATTVLSSPSACHASKVRQKLTIASGTLSRPDSQNELRGGAYSEDPLAPGTIFPILQLGLSEPPVSSTKGTMVWDILKADSLHILPEKSVCFFIIYYFFGIFATEHFIKIRKKIRRWNLVY